MEDGSWAKTVVKIAALMSSFDFSFDNSYLSFTKLVMASNDRRG